MIARIGEGPVRAGENPSGAAHSVTHTTVGTLDRCELNGEPASADDLRALALMNYGHFTSMQAEPGGVRGLDLHLLRLDASTRELFGQPLDGDTVRGFMRHALGDHDGAASLRVNVFSRRLHRDRMAEPAPPDVVVSVSAPRRIARNVCSATREDSTAMSVAELPMPSTSTRLPSSRSDVR